MAHPRHRNDSSPTVYHVTNALIGEVGELLFDEKQMNKLSLMIRQADRLFCVNVVSFEVISTGYSLICSAPAELPSEDEVREHYISRYGPRKTMPDFDDHAVYDRWAVRLRNFSCLLKDIQQRFTRWYNRVVRKKKRKGTIWKSRFDSDILKTAMRTLAVVKKALGQPAKRARMRKIRGQHWRKATGKHSFLRNAALPALTASGTFVFLFAYVLLDEFSRLPQAPFPVKILRDIVHKFVRERF